MINKEKEYEELFHSPTKDEFEKMMAEWASKPVMQYWKKYKGNTEYAFFEDGYSCPMRDFFSVREGRYKDYTLEKIYK